MIDSIDSFRELLQGMPLEKGQSINPPILDTGESAFAFEIFSTEVEEVWRIARGLLSQTQRWPVATTCWNGGSTWSEAILNEDFFFDSWNSCFAHIRFLASSKR